MVRALRAREIAEGGSALRRAFIRARIWRLAWAKSASNSPFSSSAMGTGYHGRFGSGPSRGRFVPMRVVALVPAYFAERSVGEVVHALRASWPKVEGMPAVIVVDDGSGDRTGSVARDAGAYVVRHPKNQGKARRFELASSAPGPSAPRPSSAWTPTDNTLPARPSSSRSIRLPSSRCCSGSEISLAPVRPAQTNGRTLSRISSCRGSLAADCWTLSVGSGAIPSSARWRWAPARPATPSRRRSCCSRPARESSSSRSRCA